MSDHQDRFERLHVAPAYQMVAEAIEREIVAGRIRPGEPIGTESELVRQFGVNRSTVREGIRVLEQGGLISRDTSRRLFACAPHHNRLASRMSRALVLQEVTFRELYETAMVLEIAAIEQAVERATKKDIAALAENVKKTEAAIDDPALVAELNSEFHLLLAKATQNRVLQLAREPTGLLFFPTTELICQKVPNGAARIVEANTMMLNAIRERDKKSALTWMRRHVEDWRKGFERTGKELDQAVDKSYLRAAIR
ncbi:MAG TPA: FCD domain-containing protein [Xanthobacteraceae bacterium]|nr:FCD domain-containing protein [Xanthobacteraceae bacterium]